MKSSLTRPFSSVLFVAALLSRSIWGTAMGANGSNILGTGNTRVLTVNLTSITSDFRLGVID